MDEIFNMNILRKYIREILAESCPADYMHKSGGQLEVKDSPIHGLGVFSLEFIPRDTNLGAAQIKRDDGRYDITDLGRYHNHSESPNCYNIMKNGVRSLYSHRNINPGEEITVDYRLQQDLEQPLSDWV